MDPQVKSFLTSIVLAGATALAGQAATAGLIPGADQATFANDLVAIFFGAIAAGAAWYKARQHTPTAQIAAVNNADNGVKVVLIAGDNRAVATPVYGPGAVSPPIATVAKAIALAFILSALLHAGSAYAGEKVILAARGGQSAPSDIITPAADAAVVPQGGPLAALSDLFASDFAAAETLATSTSIKDGNGQACWTAFGPFGEVLKAHPNAFTGKLATDLEAQRLAVIAARRLCDNVACNTVFTELAAGVQSVVSSLPISVGVNATPINLFAQACSHVPTVQVVAPAAAPAPMPGG